MHDTFKKYNLFGAKKSNKGGTYIWQFGYVDLVDAIINDAVKHTHVNDKDKEITVELTKNTDTKLNEIGKRLMREYSRQLKTSKKYKN